MTEYPAFCFQADKYELKDSRRKKKKKRETRRKWGYVFVCQPGKGSDYQITIIMVGGILYFPTTVKIHTSHTTYTVLKSNYQNNVDISKCLCFEIKFKENKFYRLCKACQQLKRNHMLIQDGK